MCFNVCTASFPYRPSSDSAPSSQPLKFEIARHLSRLNRALVSERNQQTHTANSITTNQKKKNDTIDIDSLRIKGKWGASSRNSPTASWNKGYWCGWRTIKHHNLLIIRPLRAVLLLAEICG